MILADESVSSVNAADFEKLSHTDDFSLFGLPSFPEDQTLWYNGDYPLYYLQFKFPQASHFIMVEYDVVVNTPLLPVFRQAAVQNIDLIAHNIVDAEPGWFWASLVAKHFSRPMQAFFPFLLVSARAIKHLLYKRRSIDASDLRSFEDWPFCEAFIPSALIDLADYKADELQAYATLSHYTLANVLHPRHPYALEEGTIVHPVRVSRNIALGKPANQSSIHPWWNAKSGEADAAKGNNGIIGGKGGFNTALEINPWWQVDFLGEYSISEVKIFNRVDAPDEVFRLAVYTSIDGCHWLPFAATLLDKTHTPTCLASKLPVAASYLRVSRVGYGELHLDEIEVYCNESRD